MNLFKLPSYIRGFNEYIKQRIAPRTFRLYYYTKAEHLEYILRTGHLKVTQLGHSNDPFEYNVTSIDSSAFYFCSLVSITVGKNNQSYKSIDGSLYSKDGKTLILYAAGKQETSFTIPDGVEIIGKNAFFECYDLTSVVISNSVISIGDYAFCGCGSLASIKYCGTEEEWEAIAKGNGWDSQAGSYTVIYNYSVE